MKVVIDQCLYGYGSGHQLLANSARITPDVNRVLLYQTDLSGPYVDQGFDSYLSAFPIASEGLYALCKTWYANEMSRPGCVWSHVLLFDFSDISKIQDVSLLLKYFRRPVLNEYQDYTAQIQEVVQSPKSSTARQPSLNNEVMLRLSSELYSVANKSLVIPTSDSAVIEDEILAIWNFQWPRLRRQFSFCTGSFGNRKIQDRDYDLQVIPARNAIHFARQYVDCNVVSVADIHPRDWIKLLDDKKSESFKKHLWTYGAELRGTRQDFLKLALIFYYIESDRGLEEVSRLVAKAFPKPLQAKSLKKLLYDASSTLVTAEGEGRILSYLLTTNDRFVDFEDLQINKRTRDALLNGAISPQGVIDILGYAHSDLSLSDIISEIDFDIYQLLEIVGQIPDLISLFENKVLEKGYQEDTWTLANVVQQSLFALLRRCKNVKWDEVIRAMLEVSSETLFDCLKQMGYRGVQLSMDWIDKRYERSSMIRMVLSRQFVQDTLHWFDVADISRLTSNDVLFLFSDFRIDTIFQLSFGANKWIVIYDLAKNSLSEQYKILVSAVVLAKGFGKDRHGGERIVEIAFEEVYQYARASKIDSSLWDYIPKDTVIEDHEPFDPFGLMTVLFGGNNKKRKSLPVRHYSELLVRTVVHKYIKLGWSAQSFVNALRSKDSLVIAVEYCLTFNRGRDFVLNIIERYNRREIKLHRFQEDILKSLAYR